MSFTMPVLLEKGAELPTLTVAKGLELKDNPYLSIGITFGEPAQVKGKLVHGETLNMLFTVRKIVDKLEKLVP